MDAPGFIIRFCLAAVFLYSGFTKLTDRDAAVAECKALGLPNPGAAAGIAVAVQIVGGVMMLLNIYIRLAAVMLAAFTIAATVIGHQPWKHGGSERTRQITIVLEHLAIVGGLLLVAAGR